MSIGVFALILLLAPLAAAQSAGKVPIVGVLVSGPGPQTRVGEAMRQGLRDLGYAEGHTIALDVRFAGGKQRRSPVSPLISSDEKSP